MTAKISSVPSDRLRRLAVEAVRRLQAAGYTAVWAGGCVRDMLLGFPPKDYDIATNAPPDATMPLFPGSVSVGKAFGVLRVPVEDVFFEVATFRQDMDYRDGRRPETVVFADPETDARRRDFTINAIFYDPVTDRLLDYVGGRGDLERRVIRSVMPPDKCLADDHLRMLRAARFASVLGFNLDAETAAAIRRHAPLVARISAERIREELTRIFLESARPGAALALLDELGLLATLLPAVAAMKGFVHPPEFHPEGDVFQHTVVALDVMGAAPPVFHGLPEDRRPDARRHLAYSALLHDVGKPLTAEQTPARIRYNRHAEEGADAAEEILRRYRFPINDIAVITQCVRNHMRFMHARDMRKSTLLRLVTAPTFPIELELHRIDCLASHGSLANYEFLAAFTRAEEHAMAPPRPWVSGHDIMGLGVPEGPKVGLWRRRAYDAQLEESFRNREELLEWLAREIRQPESSGPAA
ncbi:MAG: CCA tRNA nucleotidyltransferase [Verrucomicrobiota bacterium]|nr:CCA tRNA nucleotidyltransferase [Verrucomicrobiota bacterium]